MLSEQERNAALLLPLPWDRGSSVSSFALGPAPGVFIEPTPRASFDQCCIAFTQEARDLETMVIKAYSSLREALQGFEEIEQREPEVLDLQPLSRRVTTARIVRRGVAKFYLVDSESETENLDWAP